MEYSIYDAARAGFRRVVVVVGPGLESTFLDHLGPVSAWGIDLHLVPQRDEGPEVGGWRGARRRPWGTGFALLRARSWVEGEFAVCNADDFYGRAAFSALGDSLPGSSSGLLIAYGLDDTLSDEGGVSRGLCEVDAHGRLVELREGLELLRGEEGVQGQDVEGRPLTVPAATPVSMNLWGFPPSFWDQLEERFRSFLERDPGPDDEFYLSEAVGELVESGSLTVQVVGAGSGWLGVTFPEDRERVARALAALVDSGIYPRRLWRRSSFDKGGV